ncbi:microtubule-associated protein 9 [Hyperolius riggenbachi]|uniref:microtubule-associated protein 9 n=1 Tax=Hyperolius riggenbachi TaxID=752182 RepID=UPI0035A2AE10
MDGDEENLSTLLAYTKSPKITKRTSFQDELKKALNARVSRQQALEEHGNSDYSDEFESDDSLEESLNMTKTITSKPKKSFHDFHLSDGEESPQDKVSFMKTKKQESKQPEHDMTRVNTSKGDYDFFSPKSPLSGEVTKGHFTPEDRSLRPTPKPRESRVKPSTSSSGSGISAVIESVLPGPQHRNRDEAEESHSTNKATSLSAPSSLTRLNDKVSAPETQSFSGRRSPEGFQLPESPKPTPRLKSLSMTSMQKGTAVTKEDASIMAKDLHIEKVNDHGNESRMKERDSPSVLEMMLTNVKEKSLQQENRHPDLSGSLESNDSAELDAMFEKESERNKHNHQKKRDESPKLERSQSNRSLSAPQSKKTSKHNKQISAKSRYLGTLTVLDKSVYENNGNLEAADTLRATVYQNWLENKKTFIKELQKMRKAEEEKKQEKLKLDQSMKKEEANAAFMAWKAEKIKELKESQIKQKQQETKKLEEIQDIARRKEDCRKAFEKWKETKEDHLKEKILKEKHSEREKKEKEQEKIAEKLSNNKTAYKTWNERKETVLQQKKKKAKNEKLEEKKIKSEKQEKEKRAMEIYEHWLEKKEHQEKFEKRKKKYDTMSDDYDSTPPWSPPGRTIPAGR